MDDEIIRSKCKKMAKGILYALEQLQPITTEKI